MRLFLSITFCLLFLLSSTRFSAQGFYEIGSFGLSIGEFNNATYFFSMDQDDYALFKVGNDNSRQKIKSANIFGNLLEYHSIFYNNKLFYSASELDYDSTEEIYGQELWLSDGTTSGTYQVKDIYTGMDNFNHPNSSYPEIFTLYNGSLYFIASDAEHGRELWVTDGTEQGTQLIKDINPGSADSYITEMVVMNNHLYFFASSDGFDKKLWVSDGTEEGTQMISQVVDDLIYSNPMKINATSDKVFFTAIVGSSFNNYNYELWASDGNSIWLVTDINGTTEGSVDINNAYAVLNDQLYFSAKDNTTGSELWTSDGTEEGTYLVKDISVGDTDSDIRFPFVYNSKLYFKAFSIGTNHADIWITDGTEGGTQIFFPLLEDQFSYAPPYYSILNDKMYLQAAADEYGLQLWRISLGGTNQERLMPVGITIHDACGNFEIASSDGSIYYHANYTENEFQIDKLWRYSDGTISVDEIPSLSSVQLYPNPTSNTLEIVLQQEHSFTSISIFDMSGRIITTQNITNQRVVKQNVETLHNGIYLIKLFDAEKEMAVKRFVKS